MIIKPRREPDQPRRKPEPRRGGWSGGPPPEVKYTFLWWCLAISAFALATFLYIIS